MKTCSRCQASKPLTAFYKRPESPDGYRAQCKDCKYRSKYTGPTEQARARAAAWRAKNPGYSRKYRAQNLEAHRERERAYDAAHRDERRAARRDNPHANWAHEYRRRAVAAGFPIVMETFTRADLMAHLGITEWVCMECGSAEGVELDHVIPVAHGGPHTMENCRPLCGPHNRQAWQAVRAATAV